MQTELFAEGRFEPKTAVWMHECPTCGAPPGMTCVKAGGKDRPDVGEPLEEMNHKARRQAHDEYWRERRRRSLEQNPLIETTQNDESR